MKRYSFLFLLAFTLVSGLKAVEFSVKEKAIIYTNAVKVLEDYQTVINQMGEYIVNDIEKAKSEGESFIELFVNRQVLIYNDLDPAHKLSEFYEAETYSNNVILWYPDGITITLDLANARVSDIITHEENVYSIDILVKKSINGNYNNQTVNKNTEELTFRVAFSLENKSLGKFRIVGIRNALSNYVIDYTQALKEVNSEDFNTEDLIKIHGEIKRVLQDYTNLLSLIGDPREPVQDKEFYKESFLKLFPSADTRIYNDITPEPQINLVTATEYLTNFISDYPNGIKNLSINADSAKFGEVMKSDDGSYYTYTDADKFFSGSYKGKDAFRKPFLLIFKISFTAAGKTFSDFRINSIDISSVNFYEAAPGTSGPQKPEMIIRPVSRKGFGMSLIASLGQTSINNKNIETLSLSKDYNSWNVSSLYGFITALGVHYYFTDKIAVKSGLEYNKYSAKYNLSGKFTDKVFSTDVNSDKYYRIVEAEFDSVVTINYITLPLLVNYTSGKPGKFGFYAEGGVKISIPQKATYKNTGSYKFYGYYPDNPVVIQYLSFPELGFYAKENIDKAGTAEINGFNLAIYVSAGINIPLGYYSSITFGPEVIIGVSDILSDKTTYTDIFGKSYTHQSTNIKNLGIKISLAYKL
ncbi:MAG: outer membrane beta-barrel protein [Bacteroidia bacterium]|nr:outer membrane beta-barrel protein [Bacteroidia bacterium]